MNRLRARLKKGQSLVEFAIVLPLFLFIIMVILDLGRAVYYYSAIHNAVREGARYGVTDPSTVNIMNATQRLVTGLDVTPVVTITSDEIQVSIDYPYHAITPVLFLITGSDTFTLHGQATMVREP
jgi:Flp pilus assembly protein TadG